MAVKSNMAARFAIYFSPLPESPLGSFGIGVLGYDSHSPRNREHASLPGIPLEQSAEIAAEPARYGFHATLKAPFRLREARCQEELYDAFASFARAQRAVSLGTLAVASLGSFVTLMLKNECSAVNRLASGCVQFFDEFRSPLTEDERKRRLNGGLSPRQSEYLDRWGYPYVFEEFRFHLTLTGPLPPDCRSIWFDALSGAYRPLEHEEISIDAISLLVQDEPSAAFRVLHSLPLGG